MAVKKTLTFAHWQDILNQSFQAFPRIWWRIAIINILMILILLLGTEILGQIALFLLGGEAAIEQIFLQQELGEIVSRPSMVIIYFLYAVFGVFVFAAILNGMIAKLLVVKHHVKGDARNLFSLYFVDPWKYFFRYVALNIRMLWYVFWPLLILVVFSPIPFIIFYAFHRTVASSVPVNVVHLVMYTFLLLVLPFVLVWRGPKVILAGTMLIHFNKSPRKTFDASLKVVGQDWNKVVLTLIGILLLVFFSLLIFFLPDFIMNFGWNFSFANIQDFYNPHPQFYSPTFYSSLGDIFLFFAVVPFVTSFLYFFLCCICHK